MFEICSDALAWIQIQTVTVLAESKYAAPRWLYSTRSVTASLSQPSGALEGPRSAADTVHNGARHTAVPCSDFSTAGCHSAGLG